MTGQKVSRKGAKAQREDAKGRINRTPSFRFCFIFSSRPLCAFVPLRELSSFKYLGGLLFLISLASCAVDQKLPGIPPAAQTTIDTVTEDIAAARDEKIYQEAAEEWRQASTLDATGEFFKSLRTRLGSVKNRSFHTARGEQMTGGARPVQSFIVQYQTTFERGEGMETFTLVERDGRWQLARYFVNSDALK